MGAVAEGVTVVSTHAVGANKAPNDTGLTPLAEVMDQADLIVVGTPHDCYRGLTFRQPVIDVTGTVHGTIEK